MKTLYKVDSKGKIRSWSMEIDGANYRTISGIVDGKMVESGWTTAKGKNIGKKNETTPENQAQSEVDSKYREQLETGYYETVEEAQGNKGVVFETMLAQDYTKLKKPVEFPVYSQPKLDGLRCYIKKDTVSLLLGGFSRNHKVWATIPHILETVKPFFEKYPNAVLDGELYNHSLKNEFEKLVSLTRKQEPGIEDLIEAAKIVEFHIFDMFDFDHQKDDFADRIKTVYYELEGKSNIVIVPTDQIFNQEDLDSLYADYMEAGYEGQMVRTGEAYEMKRSKTLLKRKEFQDAEFTIDRVEEGEGNWAGAAKRVYIRLENGEIQKAGISGSFEYLKKVLEEAEEYVNGQATVRFQGRTAEGKLRFPVVKALWKGKRDI